MAKDDKHLGMDRDITRRDFLEGSLVFAGGVALSPGTIASSDRKTGMFSHPSLNPATRQKLRGSHAGSFEIAHQLAWTGKKDWGPVVEQDPDIYDLIIVGAGLSGLSAAFFYQQNHPGARILMLDNHDDFGGHAKRNEFNFQDRTILGYGGSQSLEAPGAYSETTQSLLNALNVDLQKLKSSYDETFYKRHGLASSVYFDKAHYGTDKLVRSQFFDASLFLPLAESKVSALEAVSQMPISEAARRQLSRLIKSDGDVLPEHSILSEPDLLARITYAEFISRYHQITEPEVITLLQDLTNSYFGQGTDMAPALDCLAFGLPGLNGTSLGTFSGLISRLISWSAEPYFYHFPDGNASVARLLVRRLIPETATGNSMEDVVTAQFDYRQLDNDASEVRLRLNSTVVNVEHDGSPAHSSQVGVTYVKEGQAKRVRGRQVILACYNMAIPHICPTIPEQQKRALAQLVKMPLVYNNVLLRNWRPFSELGIGIAYSPQKWNRLTMLDFPVSMNGYSFATTPDDPIMLHMSRAVAGNGATPEEQSRNGRYELLERNFTAFEKDIREHLSGMLSETDFDPGRDIAGITVNRWPHGYAWTPNPIFNAEFEPGDAPNEIGRQPFGRIHIANSDAGARAYLDCAIDEAYRAVSEIKT
ncbi:MAG: NAD(P)-binding protein [Gammaproteobacteria bacterium]|jgi:spermidine dehydrogenase|nr:NAD(P)-binding protein [Gammaproteobacteria bacterium]MBT5684432.1 NAD(P)-binding protein [Gammaproteobacteria bacterium]MBT5723080.1 NAD(P)-binding protein [Gammaproteobacteria bacterium]MBT6586996.1 NAD(P)-binding protein [Gammaproteobacteria bacterium]MBT6893019.1 NAD(P)-binding protein [Gammaproteobacteria bacterium]